MPQTPLASCTAFLDARRVAFGSYGEVARALAALAVPEGARLLVFDDATGTQVDHPWPAGFAGSAGEGEGEGEAAPVAPAAAPQVGRPRMGVVAREVTLLPRHWAWLAQQPGGASAALRRLVDEARRTHAARDAWRQAKERAYRFMGALAGSFEGFEEASRALFAHDAEAFARCIAAWPPDVQAHLAWLARDAFAPEAEAPPP